MDRSGGFAPEPGKVFGRVLSGKGKALCGGLIPIRRVGYQGESVSLGGGWRGWMPAMAARERWMTRRAGRWGTVSGSSAAPITIPPIPAVTVTVGWASLPKASHGSRFGTPSKPDAFTPPQATTSTPDCSSTRLGSARRSRTPAAVRALHWSGCSRARESRTQAARWGPRW